MADETGEGSKLVKEESETDKQIYHDSGASPTTVNYSIRIMSN